MGKGPAAGAICHTKKDPGAASPFPSTTNCRCAPSTAAPAAAQRVYPPKPFPHSSASLTLRLTPSTPTPDPSIPCNPDSDPSIIYLRAWPQPRAYSFPTNLSDCVFYDVHKTHHSDESIPSPHKGSTQHMYASHQRRWCFLNARAMYVMIRNAVRKTSSMPNMPHFPPMTSESRLKYCRICVICARARIRQPLLASTRASQFRVNPIINYRLASDELHFTF